MDTRGARFAAPMALVAGICLAGFVGCGTSDSDSDFQPGTGGSSGTGGTGGTAGTAGTGGGTGGTGGGDVCPGSTECNGVCVDTDNDPANCGSCGNACADGEVCSEGVCGLSCSGGSTECNGVCVDTDNDPANCGACGNACPAGEVCSDGACGLTCGGGSTECSGVCVNTDNDPDNCGSCGNECPSTQVCSNGDCVVNCAGGTTECSGSCVDTNNDPNNCGSCDNACDAGEVCSAGTCGLTCGGGTTECNGSCVDTNIDSENCGSCDNACDAGEVCSSGSCGLVCTGGTTNCSGVCVNTDNDPANCGGCDNQCPAGEVCSGGVCGLTCSGGTTECSGVCVDTNNDPANCGSCGNTCSVGEVCTSGTCTGTCGGGLTKCGNFCVDTQTDPSNCGACGTVCGGGENCIGGDCIECDSTTTDCDGDGWMVSDGDCCDKPGLCGSEPEKVNPGAIEVIGNGIDDNCNGKTDLFDTDDTVSCDSGLASDTSDPMELAKAIGLCRTTTENAPLADRTWGLISAEIVQANGEALTYANGKSVRGEFGDAVVPLEGQSMVVISSGIAADATQTDPGPNSGPDLVQSNNHGETANISTCTDSRCISDWFSTANPPLKAANELPVGPNCGSGSSGSPELANDSVMLVLRMRAPTNARAFSFNAYFFSVEYPEYVCSNYNDQFIALVDTPSGTPTPIANPDDKNLMTYTNNNQKWPISINVASGTPLFAVCEDQATSSSCWDNDVSDASCSLGAAQLLGTGFDAPSGGGCTQGGGTYWLTTAGNVIPGEIVEVRIAIWDVGDHVLDSTALIDGFTWLPNATLPGTS